MNPTLSQVGSPLSPCSPASDTPSSHCYTAQTPLRLLHLYPDYMGLSLPLQNLRLAKAGILQPFCVIPRASLDPRKRYNDWAWLPWNSHHNTLGHPSWWWLSVSPAQPPPASQETAKTPAFLWTMCLVINPSIPYSTGRISVLLYRLIKKYVHCYNWPDLFDVYLTSVIFSGWRLHHGVRRPLLPPLVHYCSQVWSPLVLGTRQHIACITRDSVQHPPWILNLLIGSDQIWIYWSLYLYLIWPNH